MDIQSSPKVQAQVSQLLPGRFASEFQKDRRT